MNRSPVAPVRAFTRPLPDGLLPGGVSGSGISPETPAGGSLDTYGDKSTPPSKVEGRNLRYRARGFLWQESKVRAVRACGRCKRKGVDRVEIRVSDRGLGLSGLQHCGMVWVCPVCSATIWAERSMEIGLAAALHIGQGGKVAMLTLTTRHDWTDRLRGLVGFMRSGWSGVWHGAGGRRLKDSLGLIGYVRATEVNWGDVNGWHPHFHAALFLPGDMTQERLERALEPAFNRWVSAVVKAGGKVPTRQAQDVRLFGSADTETLAGYLTKQFTGPMPTSAGSDRDARGPSRTVDSARVGESLGREMTQGARKRARGVYGTQSVWGLLDLVMTTGDAEALDAWHEYERAMHKVRGLVWSQGLRARFNLGDERDDQTIVDDDRGGESVLALTEAGLTRLLSDWQLVPALMTAYEAAGYAGMRMFLDTNGVGYDVITEGETHA